MSPDGVPQPHVIPNDADDEIDTLHLGGQIEFGTIHVHTQLNTTVYIGITAKQTEKNGKKRTSQARCSSTLPLRPPTPPQ
jgi:hypothetical protein